MSLGPEFLDELRARVPLADLVGRRVKLTRRGREHVGLCPFHNEKTPSFTVSEDKGFFHCFGCGAHGDGVGFVMRTEGLSFPEAVERLAGEAGLAVPKPTPEARAAARRRASLEETVEAAAKWFEAQLSAPGGAAVRAYLETRGVDGETAAAFRLGHAPDRRGALRAALNAQGIGDDRLIEAGLIKAPEGGGAARDYFFNRLIFPITDRRGRVIAFGGRALGDSPAKYLNSPDTPLFHKGRVLYNLARARQGVADGGELIVAEGYMDVIALTQAGFPAAVAPLGTALTPEQIAELWRLAEEPILCLDGDAAGRRAAHRAAERALPLLRPGHSLRFAALPAGEDPDSLVRGGGPGAMRAVLDAARPLAEVVWSLETEARRFDTPERQAGLVRALEERLRAMGDDEVRRAYRAALNQRFYDTFSFGAWGPPARRRGPRRWAPARASGVQGGTRHRARRPAAVGGEGTRGNAPGALHRRRDQVLLAALVNHPALIIEYAEELAGLQLSSAGLDRLCRALVDLAAREQHLDTEELKCHLSKQGFSGILGGILCREVYVIGPHARPDRSCEAARSGIRDFLEIERRRLAEAEAEEAGRRLAEDMDDEALARLEAKQRLLEAEHDPWRDEDGPDEPGAPGAEDPHARGVR